MAESLTGINGKIIQWAREQYNMTSEEAAKKIGVSLSDYNDWEQGNLFPTYAKLKEISHVFHKPSAIFFFSLPPANIVVGGDLRTLPNTVYCSFSKNVVRQFELAQIYQLNLKELDENKNHSLFLKSMSMINDLQTLCTNIRENIGFSLEDQKHIKNEQKVFEEFRNRLYIQGIYVFKDAFKDNAISGLCIYDEYYPIILINNAMSFARQIFTLFHELYHLIIGTSGAEIIKDDFYSYLNIDQTNKEKCCDQFANEFLVPTNDFVDEIQQKKIDEITICNLAKLYSVSREMIMYKLLMINKITHNDYDKLKDEFYGEALRNNSKGQKNKNGGGNPYNTRIAYLGRHYTGAVLEKYLSGIINDKTASEMLNTKIDHLSKLKSAFFKGVR